MKIKNQLRTATILLGAACVLPAQTYMMKGTSSDGTGVYDYNKYVGTLEGDTPIVTGIGGGIEGYDSQLCWAFSASDILQWWQKNAANGTFKGIPTTIVAESGAPTAPSFFSNTSANPLYSGSIMANYAVNWKDYPDAASRALNWWINGSPTTSSEEVSAGYYKDLVRYNYDRLLSYKEWYNKTESDVFKYVAQAARTGTGLSFRIGRAGGGHIMTIWGAEFSGGKYYLYITDSDDGLSQLKRLQLYSTGEEYLRLEGYDDWYVTGGTPFKPNLVVNSANSRESGGSAGGSALIGGAYYFGRESGTYEADIETRVLVAENLYVESNTEVWVDVDFMNVNDYIECSQGFYKDALTWTDSSKMYFDFSDVSGDAGLLEIMRGEALLLAAFGSTDFSLSDFAITEGSRREGFGGEFSWNDAENPTALYFTIVPEPAGFCAALSLAALCALMLLRRRGAKLK